ncbi:hypothetical protein FPQ18DRAFT_122119 [Pyronema domesticum]|uniref:Uncharacterized protein n=1 Tax=Pyronema omphalodes (strain CBS 100304) TaxID=1076935 RepID=U4L691_PYROM|nr:hypothetical protein FPQ18DRAFT_122119 [Pyronema domesticum]CCX11990.1 Similar to hypothetical protein NFIA_004500 [Neosartorya fischeri NRRL 181]; acc. no. XP_001258989 [Pyronema omphalodes CBS 100304]
MATNNIYTGIWTNHARGRVLGSTLTLTDSQALALVSVLAVLITHTSTRSFKILRYALYHFRNHEVSRDGLARQQDVLLRNGETDMAMLPVLGWIAYKWKGHTKNPFRRSSVVFIFTLVHMLLFIVAGVATSFVASGGDQPVIAKGKDCGYWLFSKKAVGPLTAYQTERLKVASLTRSYERLCYNPDSDNQSECRVFPRPKLEWKETHNSTCPFKGDICLEGNAASYTMDTGLQSTAELGINTPYPMQWQRRTTCSPLKTEGYTEVRVGTGKHGENVIHYNYGPVGLLGNSTYWISDYEKISAGGLELSIQTTTPWIGNGSLQIDPPIPQIKRDDADVTLFFFAVGGIVFYEAVDDPLFSAHQKGQDFIMPDYEPLPSYKADNPVTVMGCIEQSRICNPRSGVCTPFVPAFDPSASFYRQVASNENELPIAFLLDFTLKTMSMYFQSIAQGASILAITDHIYAGSAIGLAREQWKKEAAHLFQLGLAGAQVEIVRIAKESYPRNHGNDTTNIMPEQFRNTCKMVIFHEAGYTSISMLGLWIIVIGSIIITAISLMDDVVGRWVQKRWPHRVLAWTRMDGIFWLLRMINEERNIGNWTDGEIPRTLRRGETLGVVEVVEGHVGVSKVPSGFDLSKETLRGSEFGPDKV